MMTMMFMINHGCEYAKMMMLLMMITMTLMILVATLLK